eukprot:IDg11378t1
MSNTDNHWSIACVCTQLLNIKGQRSEQVATCRRSTKIDKGEEEALCTMDDSVSVLLAHSFPGAFFAVRTVLIAHFSPFALFKVVVGTDRADPRVLLQVTKIQMTLVLIFCARKFPVSGLVAETGACLGYRPWGLGVALSAVAGAQKGYVEQKQQIQNGERRDSVRRTLDLEQAHGAVVDVRADLKICSVMRQSLAVNRVGTRTVDRYSTAQGRPPLEQIPAAMVREWRYYRGSTLSKPSGQYRR